MVCSSPFVRWDTLKSRDNVCGGGPYLAIFQDKAETSSDGLKRGEEVCGVSDLAEEQFGRLGRSWLLVPFILIRGSALFNTLG